MVSERNKLREELVQELSELESERKMLASCQEFEKVPYIAEAIEINQKEIVKIDTPQVEEVVLDFEEKKRRHNKKVALKNKKQAQQDSEHTENSRDFQYFYQSSTGENLFLHPLCFKLLDQQYLVDNDNQVTYPLTLSGQVLEIEHAIADEEDRDYMQKRLGVGGDYHRCVDHLPDGAPYGFVEIDMS